MVVSFFFASLRRCGDWFYQRKEPKSKKFWRCKLHTFRGCVIEFIKREVPRFRFNFFLTTKRITFVCINRHSLFKLLLIKTYSTNLKRIHIMIFYGWQVCSFVDLEKLLAIRKKEIYLDLVRQLFYIVLIAGQKIFWKIFCSLFIYEPSVVWCAATVWLRNNVKNSNDIKFSWNPPTSATSFHRSSTFFPPITKSRSRSLRRFVCDFSRKICFSISLTRTTRPVMRFSVGDVVNNFTINWIALRSYFPFEKTSIHSIFRLWLFI